MFLNFCIWDIPTLIILAISLILLIVHQWNHRRRKEDFEVQLEDVVRAKTVTGTFDPNSTIINESE